MATGDVNRVAGVDKANISSLMGVSAVNISKFAGVPWGSAPPPEYTQISTVFVNNASSTTPCDESQVSTMVIILGGGYSTLTDVANNNIPIWTTSAGDVAEPTGWYSNNPNNLGIFHKWVSPNWVATSYCHKIIIPSLPTTTTPLSDLCTLQAQDAMVYSTTYDTISDCITNDAHIFNSPACTTGATNKWYSSGNGLWYEYQHTAIGTPWVDTYNCNASNNSISVYYLPYLTDSKTICSEARLNGPINVWSPTYTTLSAAQAAGAKLYSESTCTTPATNYWYNASASGGVWYQYTDNGAFAATYVVINCRI